MAEYDLPPLNALRAFEAVARRSSFKAAAAELLVTPTAISHQIRQLEAALQLHLMDRTPRSVVLTPEGKILYQATVAAFSQIGDALARLRVPRTRAILTLSSTAAFLSRWLVPRVEQIRLVLPDLDLRLHASDAVVPLEPGGIDIAIRYGVGPFGGVDSTPLFADSYAPVCSPSLGIRTHGDLRNASLLHIDGRRQPRHEPDWRRWCDAAGVQDIDTAVGLRFTDSVHALQSAIAGQGIVIVSLLLAADALASGLLVRPFETTLPGGTYHFACAPALRDREDIAAIRQWFADSMAQNVAR